MTLPVLVLTFVFVTVRQNRFTKTVSLIAIIPLSLVLLQYTAISDTTTTGRQ